MDIGPVELIVLVFPGERADRAVAEALYDVVSRGDVTVLDMVVLTHTSYGPTRVTDAGNLDDVGFGSLEFRAQALLNDDDLDVVRASLKEGTSAAVIVYEQRWTRRLSAAAEQAGGELALHVQIPRDSLEAALTAAVI